MQDLAADMAPSMVPVGRALEGHNSKAEARADNEAGHIVRTIDLAEEVVGVDRILQQRWEEGKELDMQADLDLMLENLEVATVVEEAALDDMDWEEEKGLDLDMDWCLE